MDLANMTEQELRNLQEEITRRQNELLKDSKRAQKERAVVFNEFLKANKDVVKALVKHIEDCDGENGFLGAPEGRYCPACHLNEIINGEWMMDAFEVKFTVEVIEIDKEN